MSLSMEDIAKAVETRKSLIEQRKKQEDIDWNEHVYKLNYDEAAVVITIIKLYFNEKYGVSS